jgi:hypothetical protein
MECQKKAQLTRANRQPSSCATHPPDLHTYAGSRRNGRCDFKIPNWNLKAGLREVAAFCNRARLWPAQPQQLGNKGRVGRNNRALKPCNVLRLLEDDTAARRQDA